MPILGAHMSIAGGYYKAVEEAARAGCDCVQVFTKNNNQWRAKPITPDEAEKFKQTLAELKISHPIAHDSYLINLATPDDALWQQSIDAFAVELERAEQLGIPYVVTHPGAFTSSSEAAGLARVAAALDDVHRRLPRCSAQCLLECTAGQGTTLGWKLEQLSEIIRQTKQPERLGVCLDTCHLFAAGYPLAERKDYLSLIRQLDATVGLERVRAFHLNDSKRGLGSRVDRHEHIGHGCIGLDGFRHILNDRRWASTPMYLETEKDTSPDGRPWDIVNLETLRGLVESRARPRAKSPTRNAGGKKKAPGKTARH